MGTPYFHTLLVEPLGCVLFCLLIRIKVKSGMQHYYNSQCVWSIYQVRDIIVNKGFKSIISFSLSGWFLIRSPICLQALVQLYRLPKCGNSTVLVGY